LQRLQIRLQRSVQLALGHRLDLVLYAVHGLGASSGTPTLRCRESFNGLLHLRQLVSHFFLSLLRCGERSRRRSLAALLMLEPGCFLFEGSAALVQLRQGGPQCRKNIGQS
jgi:hypothetical protein